MKNFKNSLAVFLSGLLMMTFAVTSCSKDGDGDGGDGPAITNITPGSGLTGDQITITGKNLGGSEVTIGGIASALEENTETSIVTTIPAGVSTGTKEVKVTNERGEATSSISVTGAGAGPVITSITPLEVAKGQTITINGTGLASATVEIATKVSQVNSNDAISIVVVVPSNIALGSASVRVTTSLGTVVSTITIK